MILQKTHSRCRSFVSIKKVKSVVYISEHHTLWNVRSLAHHYGSLSYAKHEPKQKTYQAQNQTPKEIVRNHSADVPVTSVIIYE